MKVLFYQKFNKIWQTELLKIKEEFPDVDFAVSQDGSSADVIDAEIIVTSFITGEVVQRAKDLKLLIVPFVGVDHMPLDILRQKKVKAANSHGNSISVAERAMAFILSFYGRINEYHEDLSKGKWHGFWVGQGLDDSWESINGKTCSIIGAGEIGTVLAGMLKPMGVRVTGFKKKELNYVPEPYDAMVYSFEEAVETSEIIVNILPLTRSTRNIFNSGILQGMKNKFFVNVGRGGTVEEKALFDALKNGILKGAAIDTWFNYPEKGSITGAPSNYPFAELKNIILSPHIAGFTPQAAEENIIQAFSNVRSFILEGKPVNEVDLSAGY